MIARSAIDRSIRAALARSAVVAVVGPRQVGKTTLARGFLTPDSPNYFDLEDPVSLARLAEPMTALWRDSGLLHQLLGIANQASLLAHPKCGASWEGFVFEQLMRELAPDEVYFWATHTGAELDGLFIREGYRPGIEIKRADAPRLTPSMRDSLADLKLDALWVIYPGTQTYALHERVQVMPLAAGAGAPVRIAQRIAV